jgi:glutathione synthase/RimK-type ligase-like ATP-grasp enzyme
MPAHNSINKTKSFAILTDLIKPNAPSPLGTITDFCKELAKLCEENDVVFYMTTLKEFQTDQFRGYKFVNDRIEKLEVPPPSVIHNRIHLRKNEATKEFRNITSQCKQTDIPLFNERFLNKIEVFQSFIDSPYLKPYVPYTEKYGDDRQLEKFLTLYETIFIKPIHGSQGRGIFKVHTIKNYFYLEEEDGHSKKEKEFTSLKNLLRYLKPLLNKKSYIIQQGIPLLLSNNRPLDFRFLCHKNPQKKWEVTSSVARISHQQHFVSNISKGGEIEKVTSLLQSFLSKKEAYHLKKLLAELAVECCQWIDSTFDGLFVEFGVDLALDHHFNPWVIEMNSKPSKDLGEHFQSNKIRPSTKAIFSFAQSYL